MSVTFHDDASAVEHLIQELTRPMAAQRRGASHYVSAHMMKVGNRRRAPRLSPTTADISVQLGDETVSAVDFSLRGIQFRCETRLVPGSTIMLSLRHRTDSPSVALGRVMWATFEKINAEAVPNYRVGVVFETVDVRIIRNMLSQCSTTQPPTNNAVEVVNRW